MDFLMLCHTRHDTGSRLAPNTNLIKCVDSNRVCGPAKKSKQISKYRLLFGTLE